MMPPIICWWIWNGTEWVEHPSFPHDCPEGKHCEYPSTEGTYIEEETSTTCVAD